MKRECDIEEEVSEVIISVAQKLESTVKKILDERTIVVADLVDSTAAKEEFGHPKGMRRCRVHNLLAAESFKKRNGTVVKFMGDSVLAVFESNKDAVIAAIVFRKTLESIELPGDEFKKPIKTRIGIARADLEQYKTFLGTDIGGQVVDKAARIQALAAPNQVLVEEAVAKSLSVSMDEEIPAVKISNWSSLIELKGFKEKTRVFEVTDLEKPYFSPPSESGQYNAGLLKEISRNDKKVWIAARNLRCREGRHDIAMLQDSLQIAWERRGVDVKIMSNDLDPESLKAAYELEGIGLSVRFCKSNANLSIVLVGDSIVVFKGSKGNSDFPMDKSWITKSYHLNRALVGDFQSRWEKAIPARLHLAEILSGFFPGNSSSIDRDEIIHRIQDRFGIEKGDFVNGSLTLLGFLKKIRFIFVVGRPGSGKSTIRRKLSHALEKGLGAKIKEADDYDGLVKLYRADAKGERFKIQPNGNVTVKNHAVYTEVLKNVSSDCLADRDLHATWLIEFARGGYREAFAAFDHKVLEKSVVIHVDCESDKIGQRLENRGKGGRVSFFNPGNEIYCIKDDAPLVCRDMGIPCIKVNNGDSMKQLDTQVEKAVYALRAKADKIYV